MSLRLMLGPALVAIAVVAGACSGASSTGFFQTPDGGSGSSEGGTSGDGAARDGSTTDSGADSGGNPSGSDPGVVACGAAACSRTAALKEICCFGANGATTCQPETLNACTGSVLQCDEKADCGSGNVCCAEALRDDRILTRCMPTCITDAPRFQVCKTNAECEDGSCKAYDCGTGLPPLKFCQRPPDCN